MPGARVIEAAFPETQCAICGIPLDARYFDDSGVVTIGALGPANEALLARFELHPQYCGVLENFSQFTDAFAKDSSLIETPGLEWLIRSNHHPLAPYINLKRIVNPWGYGSFPFSIRLDQGATIEFVIRRVAGVVGNPFTTTIGLNIKRKPGAQKVTPASMTNIAVGSRLLIDVGVNPEQVLVTAVSVRTFTAVFLKDHNAPVSVVGNTLTQVGGRIMGRYWYNSAYGQVGRARA